MDLMTIGDFAARTRLSPKALRLYGRLGLLLPVYTDPANGYRYYSQEQVAAAQLVGLLRRLGMPLPLIADTVARPPGDAAQAVGEYWAQAESGATGRQAESAATGRRALVSYIQARLTGADMTSYEIKTRSIPERTVLAISRHLHTGQTSAFFDDAFARLRAAGQGLTGIAGCPFLIFYGEVSDDSDGPLELCRPVVAGAGLDLAPEATDIQRRTEPAHEEAFISVARKDMGWPALLPVVDALEAWLGERQRQPAGPVRQVLIADQRTAGPDTLVVDLSVPLK